MIDNFREITKRIDPGDWLSRFDGEYLSDFVASGGSTVRFLSGSEETLAEVAVQLERTAAARSLWFKLLDPRTTDEKGRQIQLHRIDVFYRSVAQGYGWSMQAQSTLRGHLRDSGVEIPADTELSDIEAIAGANERDVSDLAREIKRFGTEMIRDASMTHEFRLGLAALAKVAMLSDPATPSLDHVLTEWFEGRSVSGGARILKRIGIYDRVRPMNARSTLASFMAWMRKGGVSGALIVLDLRPYERKKLTAKERTARRESALREAIHAGMSGEELERILDEPVDEGSAFFGDKAFLQMLDLLRHFIDDVELFPGMALVVLSTDTFYDSRSPRNFYLYNALQTRIAQEVRSAAHPNPVAILCHLGGER